MGIVSFSRTKSARERKLTSWRVETSHTRLKAPEKLHFSFSNAAVKVFVKHIYLKESHDNCGDVVIICSRDLARFFSWQRDMGE